jgi:hypothetical protein
MHVPITQKLQQEVTKRIMQVLLPRELRLHFGTADVDETYSLPKKHPAVIKMLWGKHAHLYDKIPKEWCEERRTDYSKKCNVYLDSVDPDGESIGITVNLTGADKSVWAPPNTGCYTHYKVPYDICPEVQGFFEKQSQAKKIECKWRKVDNDVTKFLESTKSLNAALKAWPEVRTFIPTEYLERIDKKAERSAAQAAAQNALAEIDREGAVAAATVAALAA